MANPATHSEVGDMLFSMRRIAGEANPDGSEQTRGGGVAKLVLTPQFRVSKPEVLKLRPEDAVHRATSEAGAQPLLVLSNQSAVKASHRLDVSELTAKIAALETAIAKTVDQWEPDGAGRDAYAGTQPPELSWQEDVELDARGNPIRSDVVPGNAAAREGTANSASDLSAVEEALEKQVIDEEVLRSIVVEIVRSELQGALGERITRNVRKLVRREIHRVLVAKSPE